MDQKLIKRLQERRDKHTLRELRSYEGMQDLLSNDYLGLAEFALSEMSYHGATGSRLISGNRKDIENVEKKLAIFFGYPEGLCFNSGYDANVGIFSSIPQKGDIVLFDEAIHASVRDGLRLSYADCYAFKHNNVEDLERLLVKFGDRPVYIAIEGLYSMHGDLSPVKEIAGLARDYHAYLLIDEAHSAGVIGKGGRGWSQECGVDNAVFLKLVTFGKAYGGHGAVALCSQELKEYLINFARSFIYSTALPLEEYLRMAGAVAFVDRHPNLREQLQERIRAFRSGISENYLVSDPASPIQIIRIPDEYKLEQVESGLYQAKIACKAIVPPTVKKGEECLRCTIHVGNSIELLKISSGIIQNILMRA